MSKTLNNAPIKIELPDLAQAAYVEIQKTGDIKMAYALIVSWFLRENFSVEKHGENAISDVEKLINAYKNLPKDLESLNAKDGQKVEAIKKTIKNIDDFFAEFNNKYGNGRNCLTIEEMFELFDVKINTKKNERLGHNEYKKIIMRFFSSDKEVGFSTIHTQLQNSGHKTSGLSSALGRLVEDGSIIRVSVGVYKKNKSL